MYLYQDDSEKWTVGKIPREKRGSLFNPRSMPSKTMSRSGWMYSIVNDGWHDDSSLIVTPGPLPPLPRQFLVTATGAAAEVCPECLGVFTKTQRWFWGRPVYVNEEGQLLHHGKKDYGWMIGPTIGSYNLRGSRARHSPTEEDRWEYWTKSGDKPASVTVTGSE